MILPTVMKYLLSVTLYLDNGSAITTFDNRKLYPTIAACIEAGEADRKKHKETSTFKCQLIEERLWK